jgi:integrase
LTACRTSEVLNVQWGEVDHAAGVWSVPHERMKGGREHRVPLSDRVLAILREMKAIRQGDHVFPGMKRGKPLSNTSLLALLRRMGRGDLTGHGFRSTFRDWAAERTNFPREVCEAALAHQTGSKVEQAYMRSDLFEKRRSLMDEWARFCSEPSDRSR